MVKVLAIIGATASGKSDLAMQCAEQFNGEIISCDSVQIYKYFNIGSAKPNFQELLKTPHHLIDTLEPTERCTAGLWKEKAIAIVHDIVNRGKVPIIVGGAGLYLKTLYLGMFEGNSRDQQYREFLQTRIQKEGVEILYQELSQRDYEYAQKITPTDKLRIVRALEAMYVTKIKFSTLHQHNVKPNWEWIFTMPLLTREEIYHKIEQRVYNMLEVGLIEETELLLKRFGENISPMKTIGYSHVLEYLKGTSDKELMIKTLIQDTKHFAKRQQTLFRSLVPNQDLIAPDILLKQGNIL